MKPSRSILDKRFQYVPSIYTSVADTWRRHGWQPHAESRRKLQEAERVRRAAATTWQ